MKTVQIPDDLYARAAALAAEDAVSVDRLVAALVNERVSDWERVQIRAGRGSLERLHEVLARVPDVPAEAVDKR